MAEEELLDLYHILKKIKITSLNLSCSNLSKIPEKGLNKYFKYLEYLYLINNNIIKIDNLNLYYLKKLNLAENKISDISGLKDLKNLQELNLNKNQIIDISVLGNLTNLRDLSLVNNYIKNIDVLKNLKKLLYLYLNNNLLNKLPHILLFKRLILINLSNNKIYNINKLLNAVQKRRFQINLVNNKIFHINSINLFIDFNYKSFIIKIESMKLLGKKIELFKQKIEY